MESGEVIEYWDILDKNRKPTGRTHKRGEFFERDAIPEFDLLEEIELSC